MTNANFKKTKTLEWLNETYILYFTKNHERFITPLTFAHNAAMSRPGFETQWSDTETRLWGYETESLKNVSRDMSPGIHLWASGLGNKSTKLEFIHICSLICQDNLSSVQCSFETNGVTLQQMEKFKYLEVIFLSDDIDKTTNWTHVLKSKCSNAPTLPIGCTETRAVYKRKAFCFQISFCSYPHLWL